MVEENRIAKEKYGKSHVYDKVFGRYYDPRQQ